VCLTLYDLLFLGILLPQCAYGNLEAVTAGMKESLTDSVIKPDKLILIKAHGHAPVPPLEGGTMFPFRPFIYHHVCNHLKEYMSLCALV